MAIIDGETAMAAASVAGAAASSLANRSDDSRTRKVCEGLIGALVGVFVGPGAADYAGVVNEHARMAVGFGVGAGGALLLTLALDWLKSGSFREWLSRFVTPLPK